MNQPAEPVSSKESKPSQAPATPGLYLIRGTPDGPRDTAGESGAQSGEWLLCHLPLNRPKIPSTSERKLHLRDSLTGGSASHNASILSKDPHFWDYLQQINLTAYDAEIDAQRARHFINRVCDVPGRHALDYAPGSAQRFFVFVQQPFLDWLMAETAA
jgi:hypothetical protein